MRRTWRLAMAGEPAPKAQARPAQAGQDLPAGQAEARQARGQAQEGMAGKIAAAYREQEDQQRVRREAGARAAAEEAAAERADGNRAAGQPDPPVQPAAKAVTVDVTFTLPVDVQAESVALCGLFNDWRADSIRLERGSDGWRATVPLERRSYRYRYLLDGERRKNARQAGRHVPNASAAPTRLSPCNDRHAPGPSAAVTRGRV